MISTLFFVAGALLLASLLIIFYLRAAGLHTKKMNEEQARLNKKTGAHSSTEDSPSRVSIATRVTGFIKGSNLVVFLLSVAGIGFLWWLYQSNLTITVVAEWVWSRLLFSIVLSGIATGLLSRSFRTGWASWIPVAILAGLLAVHWKNLPDSPATMPASIPLASSPRASWSKLVIPAGKKSEDISLPDGMHRIVVAGEKYQLYTVYADGHECHSFGSKTCPGGVVTKYYVVNEMSRTDTVLYAFAPK